MQGKKYLVPGNQFQSLSTKDTFKIKNRIDCNEKNVIYLITCTSCKVQYVGCSVDFKPHFHEHKSDIKLKKTTKCRTAEHWELLQFSHLVGHEQIKSWKPLEYNQSNVL